MSDRRTAAAYAQLRENLAPVVDHAAQAGVRIAVEPLNRYETSLLNTVDQTLDALDGLPAEHIGVALDTYHQNIEERDPAAADPPGGRADRARPGLRQRPRRARRRPPRLAGVLARARRRRLRRAAVHRVVHRGERHDRDRRLDLAAARPVPGRPSPRTAWLPPAAVGLTDASLESSDARWYVQNLVSGRVRDLSSPVPPRV